MPSTIERLHEEVRIPYDDDALRSGDPARLAEYLLILVKTLRDLLEDITTVVNYAVDLTDGEAIYYSTKGSDGEYPNGTWRRIQVGDNLEDQVKIAGTWTTAFTRERPA